MPYIKAVIFTKWAKAPDHRYGPSFWDDLKTWAIANDQYLPEGQSGLGPFARWQDLTGQANAHQRVLDNLAVFCAKLEVTLTTAQHFASDPRIWTLGFRAYRDNGTLISSNWNTPLTAQQRQQAANYVTSNSRITAQQLAQAFDAGDTRLEIARKLKAFFRQ